MRVVEYYNKFLKRGCGCLSLESIQELTGHCPEQPDLIRPVLNRKLDRRILEVPFNQSYDSMIKFLICTNLNHFDEHQSVDSISTSTAFQTDTFYRNVFLVPVINATSIFALYEHLIIYIIDDNTMSLC